MNQPETKLKTRIAKYNGKSCELFDDKLNEQIQKQIDLLNAFYDII